MIARIGSPDSMMKALHYNENKVVKELGHFLHCSGFLKDSQALSISEKAEGLLRLMQRSTAKTNCLHISLNFSNQDKIDPAKLIQIADDYMERIGFGEQPYLVYQHFDSGHPHMHILTTSIKADGKRIDTYKIENRKSWDATRAIEKAYGLVVATEQKLKAEYKLEPLDLKKIIAGKSEVRKEINNILRVVPHQYAYTSLEEYNAILRQYNVYADKGSEESKVYQHGGLLYHVLNEHGVSGTKPIKASRFTPSPTLEYIESRFEKSQTKRIPHRKHIKNAIDAYFFGKSLSMQGLIKELHTKGIYTQLHINSLGYLLGATFVDNVNKCAFKGSDLGKNYSGIALLKRLGEKTMDKQQIHAQKLNGPDNQAPFFQLYGKIAPINLAAHTNQPTNEEGFFDILFRNEYSYEPLPYQLRKTRKYKRKRKN